MNLTPEKIKRNPESSMNREIRKMEQCDICKKTIESDMMQYIEFARAFLSDQATNRAANALLPFDGDVSGSLRFFRSDNLIKGMGTTLMRMELSPAIYSFGVVLKLAESEFGKEGSAGIYIAACRTLDEIRAWVGSDDFKKRAKRAFEGIVNRYFFP